MTNKELIIELLNKTKEQTVIIGSQENGNIGKKGYENLEIAYSDFMRFIPEGLCEEMVYDLGIELRKWFCRTAERTIRDMKKRG